MNENVKYVMVGAVALVLTVSPFVAAFALLGESGPMVLLLVLGTLAGSWVIGLSIVDVWRDL